VGTIDVSPDHPSPSPSLLLDLDALEHTAHPHGQIAATSVVASAEFLTLYSSSTSVARTRLLDGSTPRGPSSWLRRVPSSPRFQFHHPGDFGIALATDLLVLAPGMAARRHCAHCASAARASHIPLDGRHFTSCPHGVRASSTAHHPVRDALVSLCDAVLGPARVIAERRGDHRALNDFMATTGAGLLHRPDLILLGLDGPRSFVLVDVKTFDSACATHILAHTDSVRLAHHIALQDSTPALYFGPSGTPPDSLRRMRVATFAVSTFGALGSQAQTLLTRLAALAGRTLPGSLIPESSWAAPLFAPFARQAITLALRRSLACRLRDSFCDEQQAARLFALARARAQRAIARAFRSAAEPVIAQPCPAAIPVAAGAPADPSLPVDAPIPLPDLPAY
jgi:hypothetical protein